MRKQGFLRVKPSDPKMDQHYGLDWDDDFENELERIQYESNQRNQ